MTSAGGIPGALTQRELRDLLDARALAPRHALGQNFLVDHNVLAKLLAAAAARAATGPGAVVLEVGPGPGTLTGPLLALGCRVVACEIDEGLSDVLAERFPHELDNRQLTLIRADCMAGKTTLNPELTAALGDHPFSMIANLPYGVASPLMLTLLMRHDRCGAMFVTIQKEVAERLMADPGSRDYGELSVIAQSLAELRRIALAPPGCFWPAPKVTSAMVELVRRDVPLAPDPAALDALCRVLFQKRRKQLGAILGRGFPFPAGIDPQSRPEQLTIPQLVTLAAALAHARQAGGGSE